MNCFQKKLQAFVTEFERAGRRIYESQEVSRLDVEVLQGKMRQMYDFLISADFEEKESEKIECLEQENETAKEFTKTQNHSTKTQKEFEPIKMDEIQPVIEVVEVATQEVKKEETPNPIQEEVVPIEPIQEVEPEPIEPIEFEPEPMPEPEPQIQEQEQPKSEPQPQSEPVASLKVEVQTPKQEPVQEKSSSSSVLSYLHNNIMRDGEEKPRFETSTLDLFSDKTPSIAERFENRTRSDLRTAIGVSEKFMFINDLFSGNLKEYTDFINQLNDMSTWETSKQLIEQTKQRKKWASASLAYTTLENMIQRRFNK